MVSWQLEKCTACLATDIVGRGSKGCEWDCIGFE